MAPKPMSRASKAPHPTPASKAPAKRSSKASAADGKKMKHRKTHKETYSSYIYKGMLIITNLWFALLIRLPCSVEVGSPGYWYFGQCYGHS